MKWLIIALALVGCSEERTVAEDLAICKVVCGDRPLDDFDHGGYQQGHISCRCGKKETPPSSPCDAGSQRIEPW